MDMCENQAINVKYTKQEQQQQHTRSSKIYKIIRSKPNDQDAYFWELHKQWQQQQQQQRQHLFSSNEYILKNYSTIVRRRACAGFSLLTFFYFVYANQSKIEIMLTTGISLEGIWFEISFEDSLSPSLRWHAFFVEKVQHTRCPIECYTFSCFYNNWSYRLNGH